MVVYFLFCHVITSSFDFLFREYPSVVNQYEMKIWKCFHDLDESLSI